MTFKPGLHTLTVLGSLVFFQVLWPPATAGAQDAITRAKLATVLVDRGALGSGSGFCISPKGFFLTNAHVVQGLRPGKMVRLVLSPSTADERTLDARLVSLDEENDLALLQAAGAEDLTSLPVGGASNLTETQSLTVLGYPFGRLLAYGGGYPSVSVGVTRVSALRRGDGELRAVQLDGAVNPGNSGGPVINDKGQVVAVVVSAIPGSGVSFSIPSTTVEKLLNRPAVLMDLPDCRYVDRHKPVEFGFESISVYPSAQPNTFELTLDAGEGDGKPIKLTLADLKRKKKIKLIEAGNDAAEPVLVIVRSGPETVYVPTTNHELQIGSKKLSLLELRKIDSRTEGSVVLTAEGTKYLGAISGWTEEETAISRGLLSAADRIDIYSLDPLQREVRCTLVALKAGKEVARVEDVIKFKGAPQVLNKEVVERYLQQTGQGTADDEFADLRAKVAASRDTSQTIQQWEEQRARGFPRWTVLEATSVTALDTMKPGEYGFERMPDGSYYVTGPREKVTYDFRAIMPFDASKLTAIRLEAVPDERLPRQGSGRDREGNFVLTGFEPFTWLNGKRRGLRPARATADWFQTSGRRDGYPPTAIFAGEEGWGWAIWRDVATPHELVVEVEPQDGLEQANELELGLTCDHSDIHILGRFRISVTDAPRPVVVDDLPDAVAGIVQMPRDQRSAGQQSELLKWFNDSNLIVRRAQKELTAAMETGGSGQAVPRLRAELEEARDTPDEISAWETRRVQGPPDWKILEATSLTAADAPHASEVKFERQEDGSYFVTGPTEPVAYVFRCRLPLAAAALSGIRIEAISDERLPEGGPGRNRSGNFVVDSLDAKLISGRDEIPLRVTRASVDYFQPTGTPGGYPPSDIFDRNPRTGWAIWREIAKPHQLALEIAPVANIASADVELQIKMFFRWDESHSFGRFRISVTDAPRPIVVDTLPTAVGEIVGTPRDQRSPEQQEALLRFFSDSNLLVGRIRQELADAINFGTSATELRTRLEQARDTADEIAGWETRRAQGLPNWRVLEATSLAATEAPRASEIKFERQEDGSYFVTGPSEEVVYVFRCRLPFAAKDLSGIRLEALPDPRLPSGGPGRYTNGNFVMEGMETSLVNGEREEPLFVQRATSDFFQTFGTPGGYPPTHVFDGDRTTGWAIEGGIASPHELVAEIAPVTLEDVRDVELQIKLLFRWDYVHSIGRFRLSVTDAPRPVVVDRLPSSIGEILQTPDDRRNAGQRAEVLSFFKSSNLVAATLERKLAELSTTKLFPLDAFIDRTDPYAAPLDSFEIEAQIDGSSSLWVTRYGLLWEHHKGRKPGRETPAGKIVKVNGAAWNLAWINNSGAVEGEDQTRLYRLPLGPGVWDFEVLSATNSETGQPDPGRYEIDQDVMDDHTEMDLDDNANGAGLYRIRLSRRK